jgi:hypothetical protein
MIVEREGERSNILFVQTFNSQLNHNNNNATFTDLVEMIVLVAIKHSTCWTRQCCT